eukprot:TRINITY_DN11137_c0_g1_i1.p1 TRINITY_DN11137_c0_g1~~TRINITY_DN11137_c0_g1_i1.p1  ORF type:complete len:463 (+),score=99.81 TRINITY_DN11137_c0_g1_i1:68-1456(+)
MVSGRMLPPSAFGNTRAGDGESADTPLSGCQSPLDRWLGVPTKMDKTSPLKLALISEGTTNVPATTETVAFERAQPVTSGNDIMQQQPQRLQQQFPLQQQPQFATALPQQPTPTLVYFVPVSATPVATAAATFVQSPAAPFVGQPAAFSQPVVALKRTFPAGVFSTNSTQSSSSTEASENALSVDASDSESDEANAAAGGAQRLTASQARRRRRQRAAAYARAEKMQAARANGTETIRAKGNYAVAPSLSAELCKLLVEQIQAGGEEASDAIRSLKRSVRRFGFDSQGCHVLQLAVEKGALADVSILLQELQGSVLRGMASANGHLVLQKVIEALPASSSAFIADELRGHGDEAARHQFGSRVLCRLLERLPCDRTWHLVDEILAQAGDLARHDYGQQVLKAVLMHGAEAHKQVVVFTLEQEMARNVLNKNALLVVETALRFSSSQEVARQLSMAVRNHRQL